ncbi:DUF3265 domain-containing protein [Vibrio parahaemolyticus]|nr:DUF3265 domain-containing protein [Vibrio parahaemolyticus]EGQ8288586.1 DUF3265 domain-containing protein [Vibrio parahaemolyticus]EGQ8328924.1 DUF3265 domain-containing protein [Vibrio parahaemolyticus]EGQ8351578.1 DUF3265 domain-containing protein [Vibrio parahaemolyticus]EGQ8405958.1 DUF3265 domain-containing protein [Vibrio parahaemolyticus]
MFVFWVTRHITSCSRGIRNAWHFYYALVLMIKVVCGDIGVALAHPLTKRYVTGRNSARYSV